MLMAGPVPVARLSARQDPDNNLDDERPMDEDERLDYADQEPLPSPTSTGELGPMEQFLSRFTALDAGLGPAAEPSCSASMPAAAGGPTGVQDLLSTVQDSPTGKRPLDVPTCSAAPARGATPGGV